MAKIENQNALTHGAFSEAVLLPGEDPKEFEDLLASLNDEWNPEGPSENDIIRSVAMGMWRKRRFRRFLRNRLAEIVEHESWRERCRKEEFAMLLQVLKAADLEVDGCVTEENFSKKLGPIRADKIKKTIPRKNYDSDKIWLSALTSLICAELDRNLSEQPKEGIIDEAFSDEEFADREQSFEERNDAKIHRDLKQLGQIKTMKAIGIGKRRVPAPTEPLKEIESPLLQAAENQ